MLCLLLWFVRFLFQFFHFVAEALQFALAFLDAPVQITALLLQLLKMVTDQKAGNQAEGRASSTTGQAIAPYTADPRAHTRSDNRPDARRFFSSRKRLRIAQLRAAQRSE